MARDNDHVQRNSRDLNGDGNVSFGERIKGLFGAKQETPEKQTVARNSQDLDGDGDVSLREHISGGKKKFDEAKDKVAGKFNEAKGHVAAKGHETQGKVEDKDHSVREELGKLGRSLLSGVSGLADAAHVSVSNIGSSVKGNIHIGK